jgi:hypothetical protein
LNTHQHLRILELVHEFGLRIPKWKSELALFR